MTPKTIITKHIHPPLPIRRFDWLAHFEDEEEKGEYGYGATEAEAIADLMKDYGEEE